MRHYFGSRRCRHPESDDGSNSANQQWIPASVPDWFRKAVAQHNPPPVRRRFPRRAPLTPHPSSGPPVVLWDEERFYPGYQDTAEN